MLDFLEEASVEGGQARHLAGARQAVDEVVQFLVLDVVLRSSSARRPCAAPPSAPAVQLPHAVGRAQPRQLCVRLEQRETRSRRCQLLRRGVLL